MMLSTINIPRTAPWLPPSILESPDQIRYKTRLPESVRKIFRKVKKRRPSVWCEHHRVVTMSSRPGRWKNNVTPYLAGVMDASFFVSVRQIAICAAPQTGKSEAVNNCIGVAIDQEPGPVIMVYPDEKTSDENCEDRIQPMIKKSPRLRTYMTGLADDMSKKHIKLIHLPIYFAWARSASSLANRPCKYAVNDEVDKYTNTVGKKETSAILLTKARLTTYSGQEKHWIISTPTIESGPIWKALKASQVCFDYWVECPYCGKEHKMSFAQIKWAHKTEPGADDKFHSEDPELIESEGLAWYECPLCQAEWNEYDRDTAVRNGRWMERKKNNDGTPSPDPGLPLFEYLKTFRPGKIAFHIPSWLSTFVSFGEIAASFLRGLSDREEFKNFYNKHLVEPWKLTVISKNENQILAARCDLGAQIVPELAIALSLGVDVQKYGFWFVVRAWAPDLTSWNIHYGFLPLWDDVERLAFESNYPVAGTDRTMRIFRACIDTGGGEKYEDMTMTEETYFWILKNRGRGGVALWGTKGSSKFLPGMLSLGNAIMSTPSGKKLPEALRIISIDTDKAKDQFHYRLQLAANPETRELPGAAFLNRDTGTDYVAQILGEQKHLNDKGREEWVNVHK
ncbi:MAG: terminase gpA endonuclease subunit, partial [Syntrophus sp. (in: bacteria)]